MTRTSAIEESARTICLTPEGSWSFGTQLGRGFLCLCEHALLVVGDDERAGETDRTRVRDSSHTPQETPSLASPETVAYCYAIHRRLESLDSAGFWVDSGLSLPARAGYDVRADVMR